MLTTRRNLLTVVAGGAMLQGFGAVSPARAADEPTQTERFVGSPDAKVVVQEFFSLTCSHCAAFAATTYPVVKSALIDTGKLRWVFQDYPLDQVALQAAQVARYLPPERYAPFVEALLATQDRWAFSRDANRTEEIWKTAGLAGMNRSTFDKAIADDALKTWIIKQQQAFTDKWKIDSTPSFVIDGKKFVGEMNFDAFRKLIPEG